MEEQKFLLDIDYQGHQDVIPIYIQLEEEGDRDIDGEKFFRNNCFG